MKEIERLEPRAFTRFCMSIGTVPSSYIAGLTIEEQLLWFCSYLEKEVIPAVNNNAEAVTELQQLFTQLQSYVEHYFDNLDVQEEINTKLDDMAESGELTDIIAQYLGLAGVLAYDTKAAMKAAENLAEGSITKTLGNTSYSDGQGAFYKVRQVQNTDVIDDNNIIALHDPDLVAQKILYSSGYDLQNQITSNYNDLQNQINSNYYLIHDMQERTNQKLTICKDTYYPTNNIIGGKYGLSFERISNFASSFSIQGVCYNNRDGKIYGNDGTAIFTLTEGNPAVKTVLYSIDLGHGGDCCISGDYMYVTDAIGNNIHKINLTNGNDTVMNVPTAAITNPNTTGTPKCGGICINEKGEILIGVIDEGESNTSVATGSTLRIYKYTDSTHITKLVEITNTSVYLQGFTCDGDNYYMICNKPLINSGGVYYGGNNLYVINKFTNGLIDTLENTQDYEHEGLDYCSVAGCEGLLTTIGASNFGIYSYYGNTTRIYTKTTSNPTTRTVITISRGGQINVKFHSEGTYTGNQTYTFTNVLGLNPNKMGGVETLLFYGGGGSRTKVIQAEYNAGHDELKIYPVDTAYEFNGNFTVNGF